MILRVIKSPVALKARPNEVASSYTALITFMIGILFEHVVIKIHLVL